MLCRSFKPSKCKTALKLAASRIKLVRNKRGVQFNQMKRDLAQLLQSGQDRTAMIRVEHVVREEKTMAAYDLLEIYCETIVARLPIIESKKNCPIDLKEAISSVIFASPRCSDIPELMDVRKHFKKNYGKKFASAAVELRPDCGVSGLLVEKLSAKAPDGPTKIKILREIAVEHNIKWDPESFEEKDAKPPEDFLNGRNSFEAGSRMHAAPPNVPDTPHHVGRGPVNFQEAPRQYESPDVPLNLNELNAQPSSLPHPQLKPLGSGSVRMEHWHSYNGNMKFKDATAAAQAAAESAERASMAAWAAVELSSREMTTRQKSMKSLKSSTGPRDEEIWNSAGSELPAESAKDQIKDTFQERNSGNLTEQIDWNELDDARLTERFKQPKSTSAASSYVESVAPMADNFRVADKYPRNDSLDSVMRGFSGEANLKERSNLSGQEFVNEEDKVKSEEESVRKESRRASSHSHSSSVGDDHLVVSNLNQQNLVSNFDEDPFISYVGSNDMSFNNHQHSMKSSELALIQEVKNDVQTPEAIGTTIDTEVSRDFSLEGNEKLNFGTMTGGLRNSLSKQGVENTCTRIEQSSVSPKVETSISLGIRYQESDRKKVTSKVNEKKTRRAPTTYFDSSDDSDVELPQQTFGRTREPYKQKAGNEANRRPSSKAHFDSDSSDSEEGFDKQTSSSKIPSVTGFSRRTKVTSAVDRN